MSTFYQTGKLHTAVKLRCIGSYYEHGDWEKDYFPKSVVDPSGQHVDFFRARLDRNFNNSNGYVTYQANDGTKFNLKFYINSINTYLVRNSMEIENLSGPWAAGDISHSSGAQADFWWEINQMSSFADVPVLAEDILMADKCDLLTREQIWKYLAMRDRVTLADCFAEKNLPAHAKIWCAVHPLFLTPKSKAVLCRNLAEEALSELTAINGGPALDSEEFLSINQRLAFGDRRQADLDRCRKIIHDTCEKAAKNENAREFELTNVLYGLLDDNLANGWLRAVSSYIGFAQDSELSKREQVVIKLVERKL